MSRLRDGGHCGSADNVPPLGLVPMRCHRVGRVGTNVLGVLMRSRCRCHSDQTAPGKYCPTATNAVTIAIDQPQCGTLSGTTTVAPSRSRDIFDLSITRSVRVNLGATSGVLLPRQVLP